MSAVITMDQGQKSESAGGKARGASFGKFLRLRLEINYMNRFSLEYRAAGNMSTNMERNADILPNSTPVGGRTQVLVVEFKNGHVVRFAEPGRTSRDNLQHGLEFGRRSADYLKNLRRGRLLFLRVVQFAGEPRPRFPGRKRRNCYGAQPFGSSPCGFVL
jgi:hypothetical protein